jgi:hypothetical protein
MPAPLAAAEADASREYAQAQYAQTGQRKRPPAASSACSVARNTRLAFRAEDAAAAAALRPDQPVCVRLSRNQSAFFRVSPDAGSDYTLITRRLSGQADTVLSILDDRRRVIMQDDDGGDEELSSRLEVSAGHHAALVQAATLDDQGGLFELVLMRSAPLPPPPFAISLGDAATRPPLVAGETMHLSLRRGQSAYFALPAERGGLLALTRDLRGNADTVLALLDADGNVLEEDDDGGGGLASALSFADAAGNAAFLRVSGLGDSTGAFDLVLEREEPAPPPNFPTSLRAAIERGPLAADAVLPIILRRRQVATFALPKDVDVVALTRNLSGDTDTVLILLDENGEKVREDDDSGGGFASRVATTGASPRAAFLQVRTLNGAGGGFELVLRALGSPVTATGLALTTAEAARRPTLPVGEAITVQVESDQAAIFALPNDGRPAMAMTFALGDGTDTALELLDADGNVLDQNDDGDGSLASRLLLGATPRPAFLRVKQVGSGAASFQLVLVRPAP